MTSDNTKLLDDDLRLDIESLADFAVRSKNETVRARRIIERVSSDIRNAAIELPGTINTHIDSHIGAIHDSAKREFDLDARERILNRRNRLMLLWPLAAILISASIWFAFLSPSFNRYSEYRASHEQLRKESLFGAMLHEEDGVAYIVFDEEFKLVKQQCNLNCFEIVR